MKLTHIKIMYSFISIFTKHIGPTNTKGSRIKATCSRGKSVTIPWDYSCSTVANHAHAAAMALEKSALEWCSTDTHSLVCCDSFDNKGYVFVAIPKEYLGRDLNGETLI